MHILGYDAFMILCTSQKLLMLLQWLPNVALTVLGPVSLGTKADSAKHLAWQALTPHLNLLWMDPCKYRAYPAQLVQELVHPQSS